MLPRHGVSGQRHPEVRNVRATVAPLWRVRDQSVTTDSLVSMRIASRTAPSPSPIDPTTRTRLDSATSCFSDIRRHDDRFVHGAVRKSPGQRHGGIQSNMEDHAADAGRSRDRRGMAMAHRSSSSSCGHTLHTCLAPLSVLLMTLDASP